MTVQPDGRSSETAVAARRWKQPGGATPDGGGARRLGGPAGIDAHVTPEGCFGTRQHDSFDSVAALTALRSQFVRSCLMFDCVMEITVLPTAGGLAAARPPRLTRLRPSVWLGRRGRWSRPPLQAGRQAGKAQDGRPSAGRAARAHRQGGACEQGTSNCMSTPPPGAMEAGLSPREAQRRASSWHAQSVALWQARPADQPGSTSFPPGQSAPSLAWTGGRRGGSAPRPQPLLAGSGGTGARTGRAPLRGRCASVSSLQCSHASTAAGEPGSAHRNGHASGTARPQLAVPGSRPPHAGRCARGRSSLGRCSSGWPEGVAGAAPAGVRGAPVLQ